MLKIIPVAWLDPWVKSMSVGKMEGSKVVTIVEDIVFVDDIITVIVDRMLGSKVVTTVEDTIVGIVVNNVGENELELSSKVGVSGCVVVG